MKTFKDVLTEKKFFINEVGKFWVVTKATKVSTLADIMFEIDPIGLARQFLGGLKEEEVLGIYKKKGTAKRHADQELIMATSGERLPSGR